MFELYPIVSFILIYLCLYKSLCQELCWRSTFLVTSLVWGLLVVISTELLSIFHLITFEFILLFWVSITFISAYWFFAVMKGKKFPVTFSFSDFSYFDLLILFAIGFFVITIGLLALWFPPNTYDAMVYHMGRVIHWIQNHSIAHYPTNIYFQLIYPPWAEWAIMHFLILSGDDRLSNLIQWFSMVGCILGSSLIAKHFGANVRYQIIASLITTTIPMGILQGSSTQNDYVVSYWVVCFVYFFLLWKEKLSWIYFSATSASLGLAILTKGTAHFYSFPFLIWFTAITIQKFKWNSCKLFFIIAIIVSSINLGQYKRNPNLYGDPATRTREMIVQDISLPLFISSLVKNIGYNSLTPFWKSNMFMEKVVYGIHKKLGIDTNDPRTTFQGSFNLKEHPFQEDYAANPLHFLIIIVCMIIFFTTKYQRDVKDLSKYCISVLSAFLLFCLILKWHPWLARYHLALFVLWSPFVSIVLFRFHHPLRKVISGGLPFVLILTSLPWLF